MTNRIFNFNAGPAALPLSVLEEIQASFLDFKGSGMSITEVSHRSKWFDDVINDAVERTKASLTLDDNFHVLFMQGGASHAILHGSHEFSRRWQNSRLCQYRHLVHQGYQGSRDSGQTLQMVASSEDKQFSYIPKNISFNPDAVYAHITSNNTIKGTQWAEFPDTGGVPLIADMSSDILSRPFDVIDSVCFTRVLRKTWGLPVSASWLFGMICLKWYRMPYPPS